MDQPNFVFIMTDTQGANMVGTYSYPDLRTPNLDHLAEEGIKFNRAYTTSPVCTPARSGIFTGIYPHTNGAWANDLPLGDIIKTMGQRFEDNGYHTVYIGKWHLDGHDYFGNGICPDGWDEEYWYDGLCYLNDLTEEEISLWRKGLRSIEDLKEHNITAEFTWAHRVGDRAEKFLKQKHDKPFVLAVSYDEPHGPCTCPPEYVEPFMDYKYPVGAGAFDYLEDKPAHQRYWAGDNLDKENDGYYYNPIFLGSNSFVDSEIGRIIDLVDKYVPENTYIIYTSDHGSMMTAHQINSKGPAMYNDITRIPLIIRQPQKEQSGVIDNTLVNHVDILPTMLELSGLDVPDILDGKSLVKNLNGEVNNTDESIFIEFNRFSRDDQAVGGFQPIRCIMKENYKLVINLFYTDEFYDLEKDPAEVTNEIDNPEYIDIRDEMFLELLEWMDKRSDPFLSPVWENRDWWDKKNIKWNGGNETHRPRPDNGYVPPFRKYFTGKPWDEE